MYLAHCAAAKAFDHATIMAENLHVFAPNNIERKVAAAIQSVTDHQVAMLA